MTSWTVHMKNRAKMVHIPKEGKLVTSFGKYIPLCQSLFVFHSKEHSLFVLLTAPAFNKQDNHAWKVSQRNT